MGLSGRRATNPHCRFRSSIMPRAKQGASAETNSRMNVPLTVSVGSKGKPPMFSSSALAAHRRERTAEHKRRFSHWKGVFCQGVFRVLYDSVSLPGRSLLIAAFIVNRSEEFRVLYDSVSLPGRSLLIAAFIVN